jgi:hypothetical protein
MLIVYRTCLACCIYVAASLAQAALPFHDPFANSVQGWYGAPDTTLTITTPASAGIVAPSVPFDGQIGKLATTTTFNPSTFAGGRAYVDWPYASHSDYTLSCRFFVPAATANTTASLGFIIYETYHSSSGRVTLQYSPVQRLSVSMSTFPVAYYEVQWTPPTNFAALATPAWHTLQVVLYGGTARVSIDGNFVGLADWLPVTNNGVAGGYGLEHSMYTTSTHIPVLNSYVDLFSATQTTNSACDWALFQ